MRSHKFLTGLLLLGLLLSTFAFTPGTPAQAQGGMPNRQLPPSVLENRLDTPITTTVDALRNRPVLNPELANVTGRQQVVVTLSSQPVARVTGRDAQRMQSDRVETQHNRVLSRIQRIDPSARVLAQLKIALNALILEVDASKLATIASSAEVVRINPVVNYERDLTETVPYIGATPAVQAAANAGTGVRVAVLDSGVDYTHAKLGGPGSTAIYALAYCGDAAATPDPEDEACLGHSLPASPLLFPNSKVVGGYDFVGEVWPFGDLAPDANPLDFEGHGTHVADIIAGLPIPNRAAARVRAVHASPDAPNVDILANGIPAFVDVPFTAISDYGTLPAGNYLLQVVPTGGSANQAVISATVAIEAGKDYTVAAIGQLANIAPLVLEDNNAAPAAGNAHVRFTHASPDAPAVDIAVAGGPVLFGDYEFGESSPYTPIPAGTYDLEVRLAGTNTVVLPLPGIALMDGAVYSAFAMGLAGATPPTLQPVLSVDNAELGGGVAPGASIYAVKVCSAVASSCNGVALLQGMEFAADPNRDENTDDAVDIINMSLGANYGLNFADDLSAAVENLTAIGVLTVASAGNSADKPFVTGTPAAAPSALSVAQTEVPSSVLPFLNVTTPESIAGSIPAVFQPWSVLPSGAISGTVVYDETNSGTKRGCSDADGTNPWTGTPLAGKIVLVDRGTCAFSLKIANVAAAGGIVGIIGLIAPGEPFSGGFGGGDQTIPGFMISQAAANRLRTGLAEGTVEMTIDPADWAPIAGTMVGSSSRGPASGAMFPDASGTMFGQIIKPEIGAPGASISAVAGSGVGSESFGGTSGAAPMVSGAAALLINATDFELSPAELKARLVNTGETMVYNTPEAIGGFLAPITRIGGGEVRVDRAIAAQAAAWDANSLLPTLSFGFVDAYRPTVTLTKTVMVRNYSAAAITYNIEPTFRYANDAANGAVTPVVPASITVPANGGMASFPITMTITSEKLRDWGLNSGSRGANGDVLTTFEYDGYLNLVDTADGAPNSIHLPWQVLPRKSANLEAPTGARVGQTFAISNSGATTANIFSYSLLGTSPIRDTGGFGENLPDIDLQHVGYATYAVPAGFCSDEPGYLIEFVFNNHTRQSHANVPGSMSVLLDTNQDGEADFEVFTFDASPAFNLSDGRNLTWVTNLRTRTASASFFTGHSMQSAAYTLTICDVQLTDAGRPEAEGGPLLPPEPGQPVDALFSSQDIYFTGDYFDPIATTFAPFGERYFALATIGTQVIDALPAAASARMTVIETGSMTNPTEQGILIMAGTGPEGNEARAIYMLQPRSFLPLIGR